VPTSFSLGVSTVTESWCLCAFFVRRFNEDITLKEIASKLGISITTVSALKNYSDVKVIKAKKQLLL
jgi:AraC-like DNA-binding protein